jgi:hypothetical protein
MASDLSGKDLAQLAARGISADDALRQLETLRSPCRFLRLERPCVIGDGIQQISEDRQSELIDTHRQAALQGRWTKFVPASGAASRMFSLEGQADLERLAEHLDRFAFYHDLESAAARSGCDLSELRSRRQHSALLAWLLDARGLGYRDLPKALLAFHRYDEISRTPFEEHLREAACCFADSDRRCRVHFTVSPGHQPRFEELLIRLMPRLRMETDVTPDVEFSQQSPATDLLALDHDGRPLRNEDGSLILRPGGHGALLANLDSLRGDLVFVENIDNVRHWRWQVTAEHWLRVLGGYLVELQGEIRRSSPSAENVADPNVRLGQTKPLLHRPLRVCGVVRNQGEPGGAPFWVQESDGSCSLQLVERAEVDPEDRAQQAVFAAATHFNPVFMALGVRDWRGRPFPLADYVASERCLLTWKSVGGRSARVLEHPGLWNGSMAAWNTVFVEVPAEVFAPAKTVLDLLRPSHQP